MTAIFDTVYQLNEKHLNKEVCFDGIHRKSYRELLNDAEQLAAAMQHLGVTKGDRVGISLPNWYEFYVIFLATMRIGATIIPYNTAYRTDEVHYILQNSEAKLVFMTSDCSANYDQLQQQLSSLKYVIPTRTNTTNSLEYLIEHAPAFNPVTIDADDIAIILYTSGTTGAPKGAMLTHQNVLYNADAMKNALHANADDVMFIPVPLFHVFGIVAGSLVALLAGARIVLIEKYKAKQALELIKQEKITIHHGVPTMFILELNHPDFTQYDFSSLKTGIVAAAPCPVEIIQQIRHKMHCNILVSYGLSETSPALTISNWDDDDIHRSETVGIAIPGTTVEIVDHQHQKLPPHTVGEIAVKGPGVMKGYFNDPQRTQEVLTADGWFYTGDLGTIDEDGYVRIVGRKKEMIIRGGYNIYPREIEEIFYQHPDILEVAVVGLPDTVLGEIVCAAVTLKEANSVTVSQLESFIQQHLAGYKCPTKIVILEQFPMTASGKIQKIVLQNELKRQLQTELR